MRIRFHGTEEDLEQLKKLLKELEEEKRVEILQMSDKYPDRSFIKTSCFRVYLNIKI